MARARARPPQVGDFLPRHRARIAEPLRESRERIDRTLFANFSSRSPFSSLLLLGNARPNRAIGIDKHAINLSIPGTREGKKEAAPQRNDRPIYPPSNYKFLSYSSSSVITAGLSRASQTYTPPPPPLLLPLRPTRERCYASERRGKNNFSAVSA